MSKSISRTAKAWPIDPLVLKSFKLEVSEKLKFEIGTAITIEGSAIGNKRLGNFMTINGYW